MPLPQLIKGKSHSRDNPETIAKEKKQKLRKEIGQSMDTDNEDSDNGVFRDPDIPKVKRGLPQIKENTELENRRSLAEKEWNKKVSEDYKIQKNQLASSLLMLKNARNSTQHLKCI